MMVGNRRSEEVVDPNIGTRPSRTALKRALLTALRCVDPDSEKRLTMGEVVRMLESEDYPLTRQVVTFIFFTYSFLHVHFLVSWPSSHQLRFSQNKNLPDIFSFLLVLSRGEGGVGVKQMLKNRSHRLRTRMQKRVPNKI